MMEGLDSRRIAQIADLRRAILAMPRAAKAQLRLGPQAEPACGICSALAAGNYCGGGHITGDYHEIGVGTFAELLDADDLETLDAAMPEEAMPLIKALAGALAAERSITCYLLAGWRPQDQERHAKAAVALHETPERS